MVVTGVVRNIVQNNMHPWNIMNTKFNKYKLLKKACLFQNLAKVGCKYSSNLLGEISVAVA